MEVMELQGMTRTLVKGNIGTVKYEVSILDTRARDVTTTESMQEWWISTGA